MRARCHGVAAAVGKLGAILGSSSYPVLLTDTDLAMLFYVTGALALTNAAAALVGVPPEPASPPPPPQRWGTSEEAEGAGENDPEAEPLIASPLPLRPS